MNSIRICFWSRPLDPRIQWALSAQSRLTARPRSHLTWPGNTSRRTGRPSTPDTRLVSWSLVCARVLLRTLPPRRTTMMSRDSSRLTRSRLLREASNKPWRASRSTRLGCAATKSHWPTTWLLFKWGMITVFRHLFPLCRYYLEM